MHQREQARSLNNTLEISISSVDDAIAEVLSTNPIANMTNKPAISILKELEDRNCIENLQFTNEDSLSVLFKVIVTLKRQQSELFFFKSIYIFILSLICVS